jgi:hypothetical protein
MVTDCSFGQAIGRLAMDAVATLNVLARSLFEALIVGMI